MAASTGVIHANGYVIADAVKFVKTTPTTIIMDKSDPTGVTQTGIWTVSSFSSQRYGADYLHDGNTGKGLKSVQYTPNLLSADTYDVYMWWNADTNRANKLLRR